MLTAVTAGKAAPGATTSAWALALSWPGPLVVADCDPAGGDMAPGMLAGRVVPDRGLVSWSGAARRGTAAIDAAGMFAAHVVELPEAPHVWLLPGFTTATQADSFTADTWARLALALERAPGAIGRDAIVDAGRLVGQRAGWPVLAAADRVLVTVRPSVRSVHAAQDAVRALRRELGDLGKVTAVVVGAGPYSPKEVAAALELPLAGSLPLDRSAAEVLSDGAWAGMRALHRSPLLRAAQALANTLTAPAGANYVNGAVTG